jgi:hypothetical protein
MIACCIPMLIIAGALVASGAVSPGFLIVAVGCTAMMALMMKGMSSGDGHEQHSGPNDIPQPQDNQRHPDSV